MSDLPVKRAVFSFYELLNDFLPPFKRGRQIVVSFCENQTAKHLIESLGVPHVEIGSLTVNGQPADLSYRVQDGDIIEVYPCSPGCPMEPPRFLLDSHLGRLAAHLRMLGFDTLYRNDYEDSQLAAILELEDRILLSRDRRLLMRKIVRYGYCLRSLEPMTQLREIMRRFNLIAQIHPFHRCLLCNDLLEPVEKAAILDRLLPLTRLYYDEFRLCRACNQLYWKGSHYERMRALVFSLLHEASISKIR